MKTAIYVSGFLLLISFLVILQDDFNQEWKQTQARFAQIEQNRFYSSADGSRSFEQMVHQVEVTGINVVDRCQTCHLGIEDSRYEAAVPPFTIHPGEMLKIHKSKDFGCTVCHLGQGYAVSYHKAAHEKLEFWNETMLPKELLQSSCGTCHLSEEVPEAGILTRGRLLIKDKGCSGCHDINTFYEDERRGPSLDGIGNKITRDWLYHWLKNPRNYLKNSRMPSYKLSDEEILNLIEYLMSLDDKNSPPHAIPETLLTEGDEERGQILVSESRCISCHSIHGRGGKLAPELERIGDKLQQNWLPNFLRNVHYYQPEKIMLEYNFSDQNAVDIASYLFEEFSEEEYELPEQLVVQTAHLPATKKKHRIKQGKKLFASYGCDGCHSINSNTKIAKVGPKLLNIGNRLESTLDFGVHNDIVPTLYNWIFMKLKQPDTFDSASVMPNFFLSDEEALEMTVALLANRQNNYASEYLVAESERSLYKKPAGVFGDLFDRYSCISCHSINKYGGTLSTAPLTIEGSKIKFEWLRDYLITPYAIRPLLTERMPRFRMTAREASLMAEYIKAVFVSDEIPRFFEYELSSADAVAGEKLFNQFQCVGCHIINKSGGYIGPQLDDVGNRLEAGWIYAWLKDPLSYRPQTIHPDYDLDETKAKALTAFLIGKKGGAK